MWTPDHFGRIVGGVVAFEVLATAVQSTYKLSQDQPPSRRAAVVATTQERGGESGSLGPWMLTADHADKEHSDD